MGINYVYKSLDPIRSSPNCYTSALSANNPTVMGHLINILLFSSSYKYQGHCWFDASVKRERQTSKQFDAARMAAASSTLV